MRVSTFLATNSMEDSNLALPEAYRFRQTGDDALWHCSDFSEHNDILERFVPSGILILNVTILITCETSGTATPDWISTADSSGQLGAADEAGGKVAMDLARELKAPCLLNQYRIELIDVTVPLAHRRLFSRRSSAFSVQVRERLIDEVYQPYRTRIHSAIENILHHFEFVVHLSIRSFESRSNGQHRRTDVGLLYDPGRQDETDLCIDWIDEMYAIYPDLRVRRNYPRRGTRTGICKTLREVYAVDRYVGIDVWFNRAWVTRTSKLRSDALAHFATSLHEMLGIVSTT